jgi:hypothetical protein
VSTDNIQRNTGYTPDNVEAARSLAAREGISLDAAINRMLAGSTSDAEAISALVNEHVAQAVSVILSDLDARIDRLWKHRLAEHAEQAHGVIRARDASDQLIEDPAPVEPKPPRVDTRPPGKYEDGIMNWMKERTRAQS